MKLKSILESVLSEVGESTAKPYKIKKISSDEEGSEYTFKTDEKNEEGVIYRIYIQKEGILEDDEELFYIVKFGIEEEDSDIDVRSTSRDRKTGNLYRVMATVVDCIKKEVERDQKKYKKRIKVAVNPSKEDEKDNRRRNLYLAYIKKHMPKGTTIGIINNGEDIRIRIPYNKS